MYLRKISRLLRIEQWYKNILIFSALFFSGSLLDVDSIILVTIGFILLCLSSSAGYILNDIIDKNRDKLNPDKKTRPIASGSINVFVASTIAIFLYAVSVFFSFSINVYFGLSILFIILNTLVYSLFLKNLIFIDLISISSNFLFRALAGVYLLSVMLSPWFFMAILFCALFLVSSKRYADLVLLKNTAFKYKPVLKKYNLLVLDKMMIIFSTSLILIFGLYAHFSNLFNLFYLYPVFIYILLKYLYLVYENDSRIRNPEKLFKSLDFLISGFIFAIGFLVVLY